jgi:MFS superfamily sulfate permease-like transporter
VRWIVIDAESISDVDSTGAGTLDDLSDDFRTRGVTVALARLKAPVAAYLSRAGVIGKIGADRVYLEVDDAVDAFRATAPAGVATVPPPGSPGVDRGSAPGSGEGSPS